jgi:dipeptidyl aminopeptidase/acylaminoacyl peptidase
MIYAGMLLLAVQAAPAIAATDANDGTLLSSEPCPPRSDQSFEQRGEQIRARLAIEKELAAKEGFVMPDADPVALQRGIGTPEEHAERVAYAGFECRAIVYASGGLKIAGFLYKPVGQPEHKLPVVIYLRGGNADFGAMQAWTYDGFYDFLKAGYMVLGTQYRGGPGSEGADGYGGADLDDVRALVPLAQSLGYADTENLFVWGGSRGGMQTYMLLRGGFPARAAALRAASGDVRTNALSRPALEEVFRKRIVGYEADPVGTLNARSAVLWADEITVPMILLHGSADWRVRVEESLDVARRLADARRDFAMHVYAGDDHALTLNRDDAIARAIAFFEARRVRH